MRKIVGLVALVAAVAAFGVADIGGMGYWLHGHCEGHDVPSAQLPCFRGLSTGSTYGAGLCLGLGIINPAVGAACGGYMLF